MASNWIGPVGLEPPRPDRPYLKSPASDHAVSAPTPHTSPRTIATEIARVHDQFRMNTRPAVMITIPYTICFARQSRYAHVTLYTTRCSLTYMGPPGGGPVEPYPASVQRPSVLGSTPLLGRPWDHSDPGGAGYRREACPALPLAGAMQSESDSRGWKNGRTSCNKMVTLENCSGTKQGLMSYKPQPSLG